MTQSEDSGKQENLTEAVQAEPEEKSEEQEQSTESQTKEDGIVEEQKPDSEKKKGNYSKKIINNQKNLFDKYSFLKDISNVTFHYFEYN